MVLMRHDEELPPPE